MELHSVFVTGANRGIGLEFVRQLVRLPKPPKLVFGTYRSRDGIETLKKIRDTSKNTKVILIKMDVTKINEIDAAKKIAEDTVGDRGLTLLINNAAVLMRRQRFPLITEEDLLLHFKTNAIGPVMVIQQFLPLLCKAADLRGKASRMEITRAAILNISAVVGSTVMDEFIDVDSWPSPSYSISKTSLNMLGRVIAANVKDQGILLVNMCPGWVKTDMGGEDAPIEVQESVSAIMTTLPSLDETHHGQFMDRNGKLYKY